MRRLVEVDPVGLAVGFAVLGVLGAIDVRRPPWLVLAAVVALMAADETTGLHEARSA